MLPEMLKAIDARRRIYLLRHGDVSYFDADGQPVHPERVELEAAGHRQAEAAGDLLANVDLDRIVTSGLPRTVQTAEHLCRGRDLGLEARADLREIEPGPMADLEPESAAFPHLVASSFRDGISADAQFLGGERYGAHRERVLAVFRTLLGDPSWREMAIVAHGGTNRVILAHAVGADYAAFANLEQDPGCVNIIDVDADGSCLVRLMNSTPWCAAKEELRMTSMERIVAGWIAPQHGDDG